MINKDNFKALLLHLDFQQHGKQFSKILHNAVLNVDFEKEELQYPNDLLIHERQTCNFSANENFVVFECVHRLLEKGYRADSIELEPKWKLGHGASGGRADILIKDRDNQPLLIIECKTVGKEFDKAWKATELNGDQLFSYAQQIPATQFLCLYTSDYNESQLNPTSHIISHRDNSHILEEDNTLKGFKDAQSVQERYAVWRDTYKLEYTTKGIFENNIATYTIGKDNYTLSDLKAIDARDKEGKYHQFRTILRKHNVARRENAFEVLVNLFLCKIVDEKNNTANLKFYWKGMAYDNYFDLVDRLQSLYQIGMDKFLGQEIVYISNEQIDNAFWAVKRDENQTKQHIKKLFKELKFFKGLDFDFIKVHNKKLFDKNAKVLIEIVQMWQDSRLKTDAQHQFLGDMFEYFLDNGIKQSEGQFFTPMPICRFILMALPLENLIKDSEYPPKVIDYACGAGHFLNEYAAQIKNFVNQYKNANLSDFYSEIFGIEKEDRLAKVAKVSAFMYGQDNINILDADALAEHRDIKDERFHLLVANPPFAVEGFLETLSDKERANYELLATISDVANNRNIQCFFIERAKQLLAPNGIAAIIVPSSVLSNTDATHIASREILLKHFDIIALVELGSGTFGKTGTNTVVLFLRRKPKQPTEAKQYFNRVENWFEAWEEELKTDGGVYKDIHFVKRYCQHIAIDFVDYQSLLSGEPSAQLMAYPLFKDYYADFLNSNDIKKLQTQKFFKEYDAFQKQVELNKRLLAYLQKIEKEKFYYFVLAVENPQRVLVIKSPSDTKEQKAFLGYEWSSAKGNEGIKLITDANGNHSTPLYDTINRNNSEKINHLIAQNFSNEMIDIPETLQSYVTEINLVELLDFSRKDFDKRISLSSKTKNNIESKWDLVKLENIMKIVRGASPRPIDHYITKDESGIAWIKIGDVSKGSKHITQTEEKITLEGAEKSRAVKQGDFILSNSMSFGRPYILKISGCIHDGWLLLSDFSENLNKDYLYEILSYEDTQRQFIDSAAGGVVQNLNTGRVKATQIPLPPLEIQQQIVQACEVVDTEVETAQSNIEKEKAQIKLLLKKTTIIFPLKRLESIVIKVNEQIDPNNCNGNVNYIGLENIESQTGRLVGNFFVNYSEIKSTKTCFKINDVLYGKLRPNLNKVYLAKEEGICSTDILVFRFENEFLAKYYAYYFLSDEFNEEVLQGVKGQQLPRTSWTHLSFIKVPYPDNSAAQQQLVTEINRHEAKINAAQKIIDEAATKKQAILKAYL